LKKRHLFRTLGILLVVLLLVLLVGPFLVPVPPLEGMKSIAELADPDSLFVKINNLTVHYKSAGQGEPVFILLHGFGDSVYSWHTVMEPLSQYGRVIAYDRPAFGLTERPMEWEGENPYSPQAQVDLLLGILDYFDVSRAMLVGNSAGGTIAMEFYLQHPERVQSLILVDPAVYIGGSAPDALGWLLRTPQMRHLGPLIARRIQKYGPELLQRAWYDPTKLSQEAIANYEEPLMVENWDVALWDLTTASQDLHLDQHLDEFTLPVLVITGDTDRIVPTEQTLRLAEELPNSTLVVIPQAGHVPHQEQPALFMQAVEEFLAKNPWGYD
jgi:pimeloyl-ACP methyl ester carboxylesterase